MIRFVTILIAGSCRHARRGQRAVRSGQARRLSGQRHPHLRQLPFAERADRRHPGKHFSGGLSWDEPPFKVTAPNITQDKETGIGGWSDAEIKTLLRTGIRPNGVHIAMVMPTGFYHIMTERDLNAVVAYLRTIKPIKNKVPTRSTRCSRSNTSSPAARSPTPKPCSSDKVKKGFYLATIAHCMECHTPMVKGAHPWDTHSAPAASNSRPVGRLGVAQHHLEQDQGHRRLDRRRDQARHHDRRRQGRQPSQAADGLWLLRAR